MRINFYDTRITDSNTTILVKERAVNYGVENADMPEKAVEMMKQLLHMDELGEEHCYMLAMNSACKILGLFFLSKGTVNMTVVGSREIFMRALLVGASQIILCHNHPSGNTTPSRHDIRLTRQIKEAGELMGITLTDHIIIGSIGFFSFRNSQML